MDEAVVTDAVAADAGTSSQRYPVSFTGTGGQFFKIWIVNILLTVLTVYIYSAWAKVRTKRYFYGNTILDGSSFEYHAKPLQILLSRMVAAFLFVALTVGGGFLPWLPTVATVLLLLIIPWAIWRSTKFNMRMTSYRNVRFGFDGALWPLYLYQFLLPMLLYAVVAGAVYFGFKLEPAWPVVVAFGVAVFAINLWLTAFTHERLSSYFLNHYLYGKSRFSGDLSVGHFYRTYLLAMLLALGSLAVLVPVIVLSSMQDGQTLSEFFAQLMQLFDETESDAQDSQAGVFFLKAVFSLYAYIFLVGYFVAALVSARVRNHVFAQAALDQRVKFESTLPVLKLWWVMFSNVLLLIFSLGLARPFTQIRSARLLAAHTAAISDTPLDHFVGEKREEVGAFGDELGDAFDMDMDVGF